MVRSLLVVFLAGACMAGPVPEVQPETGRPKILENSMEVKTLSHLLRDCVRCHGMFPTHVYTNCKPPVFFDANNKVKNEYLINRTKRIWLANGVDQALRMNVIYQPLTQEGKQELRQASDWLRRMHR